MDILDEEKLKLAAEQVFTKLVADLTTLVNSLDGWTLDITIPPIQLRLSRPK